MTAKENSEEILKFYFALFADLNRSLSTLRISLLLYMLGGCMYLGTCTLMLVLGQVLYCNTCPK